MKYCAVILLLAGCPLLSDGQNLVPNPGFESYKYLPCDQGLYFIEALLENWIQPIPTTPDYWNSLASPNCLLNPLIVNDSARTGQAMAGLVTASFEAGSKSEYKEYLEVQLLSKLKKGRFYNVEFFAKNRLESPNPYPAAIFEANNLGAAFSDSLIHIPEGANSPDHLFLKPTIKSSEVVGPTWQKIGGCFNAKSSAQYLLIGNFDSIDSTKLVQLTFDNKDYSYTYYFIDDVLVEELPYDVSTLVNNTTFCYDQASIELNAFVEGATSYAWEDGSNSSTYTVSTLRTKDYTVDIAFNECSYKHKFHVTYVPDISLGSDSTLCTGEVLSLKPAHADVEYRWSDGSTDSVKYVSTPGIYSVSVPSAACVIQDTIVVDFVDCPGFVPNIITPNEDTYNDYFVFENIKNRSWSLTVYNHWGELVYFSEDYKNDWNGADLPDGIYFYKLTSRGLPNEIKGWVHVFR